MELKINREVLLKAMSRVQGILEKKSNMPILSAVLLSTRENELELSATDLEISFQDSYPAEVISPGSIAISGDKLLAIAKETNASKIHIREKEDNWVYISDGNARYNLACLSAEDFPVLTNPEGIIMMEVDGGILSEMIEKTIYATTTEDAGFKLSGVLLESTEEGFLRMVATDGHRLSLIDKELHGIDRLDLGDGAMIPKKGLVELSKLASEDGNILIGLDKTTLIARKEKTLITMRLLVTKFPDYKNVIPVKTEENITVNRRPLLEAMRRMMILRDAQQYQGVNLKIEGDYLELASVNPDMGNAEEKVEIDYKGEPIEMGFNPRYFIDVLSSLDSDIIHLNIKDQGSPCLITGDQDEGFLGLVMPMRV